MNSNYRSYPLGPICPGETFLGADLPMADFFRGPIFRGPSWQRADLSSSHFPLSTMVVRAGIVTGDTL